jgi:hypothetical protein
VFGALSVVTLEFAERVLERVPSKIGFASSAFYSIQECGNINELRTRVEEIEIQQFLSIHSTLMG